VVHTRAIESTAGITNFNIEVIDIDLQDGVQAGYSLLRPETTARASALGRASTVALTPPRRLCRLEAPRGRHIQGQ